MDKTDFSEQIEIITQIRNRLNANNGTNTERIEFTINKKEIDALIKVLDAGIIYYNFTKALKQNDTESKNK